MSTSTHSSETTITLKLSWEHKQTLEKAATLRCMSLSEYLLQLALDAATEETPQLEAIILSDRDWKQLTRTLENPPLANETLQLLIGKGTFFDIFDYIFKSLQKCYFFSFLSCD